MTTKIRWGICGTGSIAGQFVEAIANVDDAVVVAVGSNDATRAERFAANYGIERSFASYEQLAADTELDVVYVASTQERHHRDVMLFLNGGHHVLCEKPFALNATQAQEMFDCARQNSRFLMEALWSRFLPAYTRLAELLAEQRVGVINFVEADFSFRLDADAREGHRLLDPGRGGGALLDLGIYPVHLAAFVLGHPEEVKAVATIGPSGVDESTSIVLRYTNGALAQLHASITTLGKNTARIVGERGTITLDAFMHAAWRIFIDEGDERETLELPRASLHFQVPEVHRCIRAGVLESAIMPHAESLAMLRTLDEVRQQIGLVYPSER